jgi:hypothetical protein
MHKNILLPMLEQKGEKNNSFEARIAIKEMKIVCYVVFFYYTYNGPSVFILEATMNEKKNVGIVMQRPSVIVMQIVSSEC